MWWLGLEVMALITSTKLLYVKSNSVLRWVTVCGYVILVCNSHSGQLDLLLLAGCEMSTGQGQWLYCMAGKVTVCLSSRWPCSKHPVVYAAARSVA